ncbi:MAG: hypothetical protein WBW51_12685, partial [Methyloceanibacter sp.]
VSAARPGQTGKDPRIWKARLAATLADHLALGHDVVQAGATSRSRRERAHVIFAFQELHVGSLVALLHDVIGHGEGRRPSGSLSAETTTAGAASPARAAVAAGTTIAPGAAEP